MAFYETWEGVVKAAARKKSRPQDREDVEQDLWEWLWGKQPYPDEIPGELSERAVRGVYLKAMGFASAYKWAEGRRTKQKFEYDSQILSMLLDQLMSPYGLNWDGTDKVVVMAGSEQSANIYGDIIKAYRNLSPKEATIIVDRYHRGVVSRDARVQAAVTRVKKKLCRILNKWIDRKDIKGWR